MEFNIITIPHESQEYETVGNYIKDFNKIDITVSETDNGDYNFLIGLHEFVESYLCHKRKINFDKITRFDIKFEKNRKKGNMDEPGDSKKAPYYKEHQFATKIEKMMAKELGVNWKKYDETVMGL